VTGIRGYASHTCRTRPHSLGLRPATSLAARPYWIKNAVTSNLSNISWLTAKAQVSGAALACPDWLAQLVQTMAERLRGSWPLFAFVAASQLVALVALVAMVVRHLRSAEQLRRLSDTALAIARGDKLARCGLLNGPLAQFGSNFDDMVTLLSNEIRSLRANQRELEQLIATDRLTGIGNRRQFEQQADAEAARAKRYGIPVSLILFDVDHFKRINDRYGHQVGDSVLVNLTRRVAHRLRDTDSIARWGGEEFAILTPCTPISGAEVLAEKIRQIVAEEPFDVVGTVTVSLGVAQMHSSETASRWIARADELLYEAKHAGRNRMRSNASNDEQSAPFILVWGDQFLVNHPTIDAEHAELFRLANNLILSAPQSTRSESLDRINLLSNSLESHFSSEEAILLELGCPTLEHEKHAQMHRGLTAELSDLKQRYEAGRLDLHDVGDFIVRRVTIGHLVSADLALFASLVHSATIAVADEPRPSLRIRIQRALLG